MFDVPRLERLGGMQRVFEGNSVVVAGNGPSLCSVEPGRVLATDVMVRINSFFFEPEYYLGQRVDLAFVSGDPRVVPFLLATLKAELSKEKYKLGAWVATHPKSRKVAARKLGQWPELKVPSLAQGLQRGIDELMAKYQAKPTSGIQAILVAHAMGAHDIILTGVDLYQGDTRYVFTSGVHQEKLLGDAVHKPDYDRKLHSRDLDCSILELLQKCDVSLACASSDMVLTSILDVAPVRDGEAVKVRPHPDAPQDWNSWSGIYPIQLLMLLRKMRRLQSDWLLNRNGR
ncbi:alpha-2,3-sialyltransferase [Aliiroseovarius crassostreae]|uniref:alpha-2,3-sialyltransferase n=1 Tax=Aliiroseovarius crassostreae TaxID=154981 RepID=UPI003C7EBBFA